MTDVSMDRPILRGRVVGTRRNSVQRRSHLAPSTPADLGPQSRGWRRDVLSSGPRVGPVGTPVGDLLIAKHSPTRSEPHLFAPILSPEQLRQIHYNPGILASRDRVLEILAPAVLQRNSLNEQGRIGTGRTARRCRVQWNTPLAAPAPPRLVPSWADLRLTKDQDSSAAALTGEGVWAPLPGCTHTPSRCTFIHGSGGTAAAAIQDHYNDWSGSS